MLQLMRGRYFCFEHFVVVSIVTVSAFGGTGLAWKPSTVRNGSFLFLGQPLSL